MRQFLLASAFLLPAAAGLYAQLLAPELLKPENRTVSSSKQFSAFGGSREARGDVIRRAEQLREALHTELNVAEEFRAPILFTLLPQDGLRLRQPRLFPQVFDAGDAGRKLQLDLTPSILSDRQAVDDAIGRSMLLELALRRQKFSGNRFVEPPAWLVGAMSAVLARREPGEEARLYSTLLGSKGMPKLDRFLRQDAASLHGRAREIYEAQSLALYRALLELPGGRAKIMENLMLAEPSRDPVERFAQTWPELVADPTRLARLWALGMARLSSPGRIEYLSAEESSARLASILKSLELSGQGMDAAEKLVADSKEREGRFRMEQAAAELRQLGFRAHPLYVALVEEYRVMLDNLSRGKRRGMARRFGESEDLRMALDVRSAEMTDFLNWYQVNAVQKAPVIVPPPAKADAPMRNDAITRYLDSVEQRGW